MFTIFGKVIKNLAIKNKQVMKGKYQLRIDVTINKIDCAIRGNKNCVMEMFRIKVL